MAAINLSDSASQHSGNLSSTKRTKIQKTKLRGLILAALAAVTFGLYPPATKMAYQLGANSSFIILTTTFSRALALAGYCLLMRIPILPARENIRPILIGGLLQTLSIFGILASLHYLPGPVAVTIIFTHTMMLLLYMSYRGETQLTPTAIGCTIIALIGVGFVVNVWHQTAPLPAFGIALALVGALATMSRLYVFGKQVIDTNPAAVGAQVFGMATIFCLAIALFSWPIPPTLSAGYLWTALACLSLILGSFAMFFGIAAIGSFEFSLMVKLEPVFTAAFSLWLLGELLTVGQYFGMGLVLSSQLVYQIFNRPPTGSA